MSIGIDETIDKDIYKKVLTNDKVINITGEGGSGKSTLANKFREDSNYVVVDYDLIFQNPNPNSLEYELKQMLLSKYGYGIFESISKIGLDKVKENFTIMYTEIINHLKNSNKIIVLDGTQLRFINDVNLIKGELIALRPSIKTCISRSTKRFIFKHPDATTKQIEDYTKTRAEILHILNPLMNELILNADKIPNLKVAENKALEEQTPNISDNLEGIVR